MAHDEEEIDCKLSSSMFVSLLLFLKEQLTGHNSWTTESGWAPCCAWAALLPCLLQVYPGDNR